MARATPRPDDVNMDSMAVDDSCAHAAVTVRREFRAATRSMPVHELPQLFAHSRRWQPGSASIAGARNFGLEPVVEHFGHAHQ